MLSLEKKALERGASIDSALEMCDDHNISIVTGECWLNNDVISIANIVLDHRVSSHEQGIALFSLGPCISHAKEGGSVRINIEGSTGCDGPFDGNTGSAFGEFDASTLPRYLRNPPFLFQLVEMVVDMPSTGNTQLTAKLPIGGWHTLRLDGTDNK